MNAQQITKETQKKLVYISKEKDSDLLKRILLKVNLQNPIQ